MLLRMTVAALLCGHAVSLAADPQQVRYWLLELDRGIQAIAADTQGSPWPHLQIHALDGSVKVEEKNGLELALKTQQALAAEVAALRGESSVRQAERYRGYLSASDRLRRAGGYANLLLAESLRRVVIFSVSTSLIKEPQKIELLGDLCDSLARPLFDRESFGKMLTEETGVPDAEGRVKNAGDPYFKSEEPAFQEALRLSGADARQLMREVPERTTSELLRNRDLGRLLMRVALSDRSGSIGLYVFATFIRKGGDVNRLFQGDYRHFEDVIGGKFVKLPYPVIDARIGLGSDADVKAPLGESELCDHEICQIAIR